MIIMINQMDDIRMIYSVIKLKYIYMILIIT